MAAFLRAFMTPPDMSESLVQGVRCVAPVGALLGEGPLYDPRARRLHFLDIKGGRLFSYDPQSEKTAAREIAGEVSALALRRRGGYVCAFRNGFATLDLDDGAARPSPLFDPESDRPGNRFNDGKADPSGGFWSGTMDDSQRDADAGAWWRLDAGGAVAKIDGGFHVTNGPAFDPARKRVYFTDSARRIVYVAQSDGRGAADRRAFLAFEERDGYPDGMDLDREGCLWIAFWDGAAVRRYSPEGDRIDEVKLPVPRPTSVALIEDRAFVTSARIGLSGEALAAAPLSGGLFELTLRKPVSAAAFFYDG